MTRPDPGFWHGKRVLLTGHTGFKGAWLALWLQRLGAEVTGFALAPDTTPSLYALAGLADSMDSHIGDIRDPRLVRDTVRGARPDIVLHLAAQALVRPGYERPLETYATNVMGTAHLLDAVRGCTETQAVVVVTSDKVYRNRETAAPYHESDALGGHDPYSASKAAAELVTASYRDAFLQAQGIGVVTARAGNVIGGGDWSVDRLLPDVIRAWQAGVPLCLRRPQAVRPWQHVLEPLAGYLRLAESICAGQSVADSYNFGPDIGDAVTVAEIVALARDAYGSGEWTAGDGTDGPPEAGVLVLDSTKAKRDLGVSPRWELSEAVARSMAWYLARREGADARALCDADFTAYEGA